MDSSKPLAEEMKMVDRQKENAKRQYQIRHELEKEYKQQDLAEQDRRQAMSLNKYNPEKYQEEFKKGYNLINNHLATPLATGTHKRRLNVWQQI